MVTSVNEMRPTSVIGLVLSQAGSNFVGTAGTSFFIKVVSARMRHRTPLAEVSGDGDQAPRFSANYWLYADWLIRGWAVAGQAIGIANMKSTTLNPTAAGTLVTFDISNDSARRVVKGTFLIHDINIEWHRTSSYVGLSLAMKNTCTDADGEANYVEATS